MDAQREDAASGLDLCGAGGVVAGGGCCPSGHWRLQKRRRPVGELPESLVYVLGFYLCNNDKNNKKNNSNNNNEMENKQTMIIIIFKLC